MTLFEKAIEHDWFLETEPTAKKYLQEKPDGTVRPLAQIVATMARAEDGKFDEACLAYKQLMKGLGQEDQEEFAANFADSLATAASAAGEYGVAREVYEGLLERFTESPKLRAKVRDDLNRLDMIGQPAPFPLLKDLSGKPFRLGDLKGKYVLVDFWATWCAPCVAELPNVQAAYEKYRDKGFDVVSISLDETSAPLADFLKTHRMPWKQIHNATSGADVVDAFGVNTIPATFLVDPEGKVIRLELRGPNLGKTLERLIK